MNTIFLIFILLFFNQSAACMSPGNRELTKITPERQKILDRKALRNFIMHDEAKDLQVKLGTELCRAAYLEQFYVPVPTVKEKNFFLNNFRTLRKKLEVVIGYYPSENSYFRGCAINHVGTRIAIPVWPDHLFIKDLNEALPKQIEIPLDNIYKNGWVSDVEWSAQDTYISFNDNSKTLIYNVHTSKYVNSFKSYIYCWHPQKDECLFMINEGNIHIVNVLTGDTESIPFDTPYSICDFACSPDCRYLAIDEHDDISIVDLNEKSYFQCNIKSGHITLLTWSSDSRYLAFQCGASYALVVWDVENNKSIFEEKIHQLKSLAWTNHDEQLVGVLYPCFNPKNGMMITDQQRIFINPWKKQVSEIDVLDSASVELMEIEQDLNSRFDTVPGQQKIDDEDDMKDIYPLYDHYNHSIEHFKGQKTKISHQGRFIVNIDKKHIIVRDYTNELFVLKYLRNKIPLNQTLVLLALGKKARNKEKLIIDSPAMQKAFDQLPDCLKVNLQKWIIQNATTSDNSCVVS